MGERRYTFTFMNDQQNIENFNVRNANERDVRIAFDPAHHVYTYVGGDTPLVSVTNLVSTFFPEFDVRSWAMSRATKLGSTPEQVIAEWERNGLVARNLGIFMHEQIENILLRKEQEETFSIDVPGEGAVSQNISEELRYFRHFLDDVRPQPYRTEWQIYDETYDLAGTLDLLAQNHNGDYVMYDWKRSKRMGREVGYSFYPNDRNPYISGINGLNHLPSTPFIIGSLQQNLYRYILKTGYGIEVKEMYLVMLSNSFTRYHCVPVPLMEHEVEIMLSCIRK